MAISEKAVEEFQEIFKEVYGKEISKEKAREYGQNLFRFVKAVYKKD